MAKYLKLFNNHSGYTAFTQTEEFVKPNVSHCILENEVHYNPLPNANGHAYVDLGLPSGTLWATMNLGATSESEYGLYFQWGDTQGYAAAQVGTSKQFSWTDYRYSDGGSTTTSMTKYNTTDNIRELEFSDDAANFNWGGDWKMPTFNQMMELVENTTSLWGNVGGVNGITLTSNNNGNTIFFPAVGGVENSSVSDVGEWGYYWSNTLGSAYQDAVIYYFSSNYQLSSGASSRCYGNSVRAVLNQ